MKANNGSPIHRELASFSLAFLLGLTCLGMGHWVCAKLVERSLSPRHTAARMPSCEVSPRTAGFGGPDCEELPPFRPMQLR